MQWISHMYTYIPPVLSLPPTHPSTLIIPLEVITEPGDELPVLYSSF